MKFMCSSISFAVFVCCIPNAYSMDVNNGGGDIISKLPCVKRLNQLSCGGAGNSYPSKSIDKFIDDNKALLRRMYGVVQETRTVNTVRVVRWSTRYRRDVLEGTLEVMMEDVEDDEILDRQNGNGTTSSRARNTRQADFPGTPSGSTNSGKEDVCLSKVEIVTPHWASNSNDKVRAILNNHQFEQAIHQEICSKPSTTRCTRDCGCEQKYKWHRLLAYDPNNDCSGIFMDWFLFPACCVCRCSTNPFFSK